MVRFVDLDTDEVVNREMTNAEFAVYEAKEQLLAEQKTETQAKAQAKAVLLERLGLTQEEFNTLTA